MQAYLSGAEARAVAHKTSTRRQRLERRQGLGFLLLEQRFMARESCRESLRLNYTDGGTLNTGETTQALERVMGAQAKSGIERGDVSHQTHLHQGLLARLSSNTPPGEASLDKCSHRNQTNGPDRNRTSVNALRRRYHPVSPTKSLT